MKRRTRYVLLLLGWAAGIAALTALAIRTGELAVPSIAVLAWTLGSKLALERVTCPGCGKPVGASMIRLGVLRLRWPAMVPASACSRCGRPVDAP